jgi:hypothetical protein
MEPVISLILPALAAGAQAAATGIATDEVKHIYNELKTLIQQKWIGKPSADKLLSEYEKDPESWEEVLAEKLEQSGIAQDKHIVQKAEQLLQKINISTTVNQSRKASSGHTATTGATISEDTISAGQNAYKIGRDFSQSTTHNRQTRLAVLLWFLALALTGVIGFGVYLFMTGRLQLPGQPTTSGQFSSNGKPPVKAEQRVTLTTLSSIQEGMTLEETQTKLGVQLRLYSDMSYASIFGNTWVQTSNIKRMTAYSCTLEDGSLFYLTFIQHANSDSLNFFAKSATPPDLMKSGSSN